MFIEWLCNMCKPLNEPPVVANQTKEKHAPQYKFEAVHALQLLPSSNCWVAPHPLRLNVPIGDFFPENVALQWLQFQIVFSKINQRQCVSSEGVL